MARRRGPVDLDRRQCEALLASGGTGRIGVSTALGPQVIPVSYAVVDRAVVLWSSPYSPVARCAPGTLAAFEVDHVDQLTQRGWCVHARGRVERLEDPGVLAQIPRTDAAVHPTPWEEQGRRLYLRIRWTELSGQAVGTTWDEPPTPAVNAATIA